MDREQKEKIVQKLNSEKRRKILPVAETLGKIGFEHASVIADIGCGIGYFTLPIAQQNASSSVYGLDVSGDMLDIMKEHVEKQGVLNITAIQTEAYDFKIGSGLVDVALLCNVLHEIDDKSRFLAEAARILKAQGKIAIVEWRKIEESMGPPLRERLSADEIVKLLEPHGFFAFETFEISGSQYALTAFKKV